MLLYFVIVVINIIIIIKKYASVLYLNNCNLPQYKGFPSKIHLWMHDCIIIYELFTRLKYLKSKNQTFSTLGHHQAKMTEYPNDDLG